MNANAREDLNKAMEVLMSLHLDEDLRQDAALRLCRTIHDFDAEKGSINTWVWWAIKKVRYQENVKKARRLQTEESLDALMENAWTEPGREDLGIRSMEFMDSLKDLSPQAQWMAKLAVLNGVRNKTEIAEKCLKLKKAGRTKPVKWTYANVKETFDEIRDFLDGGKS